MVLFRDMLIDTPYPLLGIEDRRIWSEPETSQCSYCRAQGNFTPYDSRDVVVVRRWKRRSVWQPELDGPDTGGRYEWRCQRHPFDYSSSPYAGNAPDHLRPPANERCENVTLSARCSNRTGEQYEGRWLCAEHSTEVVERLRVEERLREIDEQLSGDADDTPL